MFMIRRVRSLKGRLLLLSLVFLPLLLGVAGVALDQAFSRSLLASQLERLKVQVYLVLGALDFENGELNMPESLTEPRYGQLNSGLYALIASPDGEVLWRSPSSASIEWTPRGRSHVKLGAGQSWFETIRLGNRDLFQYRLAVIWEHLGGDETPMIIYLLEDQAPWQAEVSSYRTYLWVALGGIAAAWFLLLLVLVRWGLLPLDRLARDLEDMERGSRQQLEGDYPAEVEQLTRRLNQLIKAERQQREKYRNTLADLAHSLKTPLAVMRGLVSPLNNREPALAATESRAEGSGLLGGSSTGVDQLNEDTDSEAHSEIEKQVDRMDQIVAYQLQRAVMAADQRLLQAVELLPLVRRLMATLDKVYHSRQIQTELEADDECRVLGDERDFMEVLGNILDNAYKYGRTRVRVRIAPDRDNPHQCCRISVEDDGSGIDPAHWHHLIRRGVRADQIQPGQGIGLAVAADIMASYQGGLRVERSALGGAQIEIRLARA